MTTPRTTHPHDQGRLPTPTACAPRPEGAEPDLAVGDLLSAFDHAPIGMGVVLADGSLVAANRALGLLLGRPAATLLGTTLFDVTEPDDVPAALEACALIGSGRAQVLRHECRFRHADGSVRWVLVSSARLPRDGRGLRIVLHVEDVSDRHELEDRLRQQALHDPLTGLPNRLLLLDRVEHALAAGRRGSHGQLHLRHRARVTYRSWPCSDRHCLSNH